MASSSQHSGAPSLDAYRDGQGNIPLVPCKTCGAQMIGLVSQKEHSFGQRFYKCPLANHNYMWEEQYIEYLITKSKLPQCFSKVGRGTAVALTQGMEARMVGTEMIESLKESIGAVERCSVLLESTTKSLKDAEAELKKVVDGNQLVGSSIDKIGDRLLVLGLANLFIVVLLLMVVLVK